MHCNIAKDVLTKFQFFRTLERVFDLPSETDYRNYYWIGVKSYSRTNWNWINGHKARRDEYFLGSGNGICAVVHYGEDETWNHKFRFRDIPCNFKQRAICERPILN